MLTFKDKRSYWIVKYATLRIETTRQSKQQDT